MINNRDHKGQERAIEANTKLWGFCCHYKELSMPQPFSHGMEFPRPPQRE